MWMFHEDGNYKTCLLDIKDTQSHLFIISLFMMWGTILTYNQGNQGIKKKKNGRKKYNRTNNYIKSNKNRKPHTQKGYKYSI